MLGNAVAFATVAMMLILASASPRRHELLEAAGIPHVLRAAAVPENRITGEDPVNLVQRLAREKASAVECGPGDVVLGADTEVSIGDQVFGKPCDEEDAARMLRLLSGRDHWVHTGICIVSNKTQIVDVASTRVSFAQLTEDEITGYTRSGEPFGKAGGYAIQGLASKFVRSIEGCYHNVVGLPVSLVYHHLKSL
jgi:septum formation protein